MVNVFTTVRGTTCLRTLDNLNTVSSVRRHLKHTSLNWRTIDVIGSPSHFNDIAMC